ncbi:MAG TPA: alpha/beta fold hydrolase, partial [Longimicrobiaceae bacterium]|nr:alpha/beta fold hydrolase [Longimicrobiaceae bacterium]
MPLHHTRIVSDTRTPARWLLVLHGIYGSGRNWGTVARRLVDARPEWGVILVDLRLHGGSQGFPPPHTLATAAGDVEALAEELGIRPTAILGHSFGGKVALVYAAAHAEGLHQVWVMDSTIGAERAGGSTWRIMEIVRSMPEAFGSREEMVDRLAEHGYPKPLGNWLAMNLERHGDRFRWRLDWEGVAALLRDYYRRDLWQTIENPPDAAEIHVVKATDSGAISAADEARIEAA